MHHPNRGILIGIAGGSASGKTSVATKILEGIGSTSVAIVAQDSYYLDHSDLPPAERAKINYDHPVAFDNILLMSQLALLREGKAIQKPLYDYATHSRLAKTQRISPSKVIIVEGIMVLVNRDLRALLDIKIYVDTDPDVRFIRRLERDINDRGRTAESVIKQYLDVVRPMHLEFVEPSKRFADIIIPEGGFNKVAVDIIVTKLRSILRSERS
ncbi:MAG: uridine kinase [bacterium]